jgi:hypothetical protein
MLSPGSIEDAKGLNNDEREVRKMLRKPRVRDTLPHLTELLLGSSNDN